MKCIKGWIIYRDYVCPLSERLKRFYINVKQCNTANSMLRLLK